MDSIRARIRRTGRSFTRNRKTVRCPGTICGRLHKRAFGPRLDLLRVRQAAVGVDAEAVGGELPLEQRRARQSRRPLQMKTQRPTNSTATNPTAGSAPAEAIEAAAAFGGGGGGGRGGAPNIINAPAKVDTFRFYWNAPFEMSPHNPSVVYMAAQFFFKSNNRGDTWTMNPADLTKNVPRWSAEMPIMNVAGDKPMAAKHDGYSSSSLITQVRESPSKPGVIWIGTDDGNLQVSQDGGDNFTNVSGNVTGAPKGYVQVSRIEPSHFDPGTAYVALDAHRLDDWKPYLFKTKDYGKSWTSVTGDLPKGNINALREDMVNPDLLFVGTEFGLYVTLDDGKAWKKFMAGLPTVRVDDILIHPRDHDLIIGTHGRSIWICDDISPLENMKKADNQEITLFDPRPAILWKNDAQAQRHAANREFLGENPQGGTAISILAKGDAGAAKVEFMLAAKVVSTMDVILKAGMNRFQWNMRGPAVAGAGAGGGRGGGGGGGGGGRGAVLVPDDPSLAYAPAAPRPTGPGPIPFVAGGGRGGGGGGGGGGGFGAGVPQGPLLEPGTFMVKVTAGGKTAMSSVNLVEDVWLNEH